MYRYLFVIVFLTTFGFAASAQTVDTAIIKSTDTVQIKRPVASPSGSFAPKIKKEKEYNPDSTHSPHKAVIHSLIVPGWGQLYNHKWWKVPIIYTGIGLLVSAVVFNQHYYNEFIVLSKYRQSGIPPQPGDKYYAEHVLYQNAPDQSIYNEVDSYRRNRDLSILGILGAWGIQTIDAYIDAKFIHSYTVDNDLAIKVTPGIINQPVYAQNFNSSFIPGIKITFTF